LAGLLHRAGCKVSVITCGDPERDNTREGLRIKRIRSPNIYWNYQPHSGTVKKLVWHFKENVNPTARSRIKEVLADFGPDVVVTSTIENFGAEAWVAPHEANIPCVHIIRSYYPFCWEGNAVRNGRNCDGACLDCAVLSWGRKRASKHVSGVVGISDYALKRHLQQGLFPTARTVLIPEPISESAFVPRDDPMPMGRFGYLGVLSPDKGLETLAAAWRRVGVSQASLAVAGRGGELYTEKLKGMFSADVRFEGWVDSARFIATIDFLIVPSVWNEPFGRIIIEAFAQGVPVIGSQIAGIGETVRNSKNGFTFTPGSVEELARLIRRCAAITPEDYRVLSRQASLDVKAYGSSLVCAAHIAFYDQVIRNFRASKSQR